MRLLRICCVVMAITAGGTTLAPTTAEAQFSCVFCDNGVIVQCKGAESGSKNCAIQYGHCWEWGNCFDREGLAWRPEAVLTYASISGVPRDRSITWDLHDCHGNVIGRVYSASALEGRLGEYRGIELLDPEVAGPPGVQQAEQRSDSGN